jgi:ribose 5-phosphate isomerase A
VDVDQQKREAAQAGAQLVSEGMRVGLGTGTTVQFLLEELARRALRAVYVASSPRTEVAARALGIDVVPFNFADELDIAIDGADQVAPDGWIIKGAGAALTREKIVAVSAKRFVVICDASKIVAELEAPVPLELLSFGVEATLTRLSPSRLRDVPASPDGGLIGDYFGDVSDPQDLSARLSSTPGVISHGLFAPDLVSEVLVGRDNRVQRLTYGGKK